MKILMNLRSVAALSCLIVCSVARPQAQSDAGKALANEPEIRQINGANADRKAAERLPENDSRKPSLAGSAIRGALGFRTEAALLDQLEARLNTEAQACNYCASKQGELSQLIRERMSMADMADDVFHGTAGGMSNDDAAILKQVMGLAPVATRWQDKDIAIQEAAKALSAHCQLPKNSYSEDCRGNSAERLAGEHEIAWAKCFGQHDWVLKSQERAGYEGCMSATDPLTRICAEDHPSPTPATCPRYSVDYSDVDSLRSYRDRWTKQPLTAETSVLAVLLRGQAEHVTLLEPMVVPAPRSPASPSQGFTVRVRARVDTPLLGTSETVPGQAVLVPAGSEILLEAIAGTSDQSTAGANIDLRATTVVAGTGVGKQVFSQPLHQHLSNWPAAGTILAPVGTQLKLTTVCGCNHTALIKNFRPPREQDRVAPPGNGVVSVFSDAGSSSSGGSGTSASASSPAAPARTVNPAQLYGLETIRGDYSGSYSCHQGKTGLEMTIDATNGHSITAIFKAKIAGLPAYDMAGTYDPRTLEVVLRPVRWRGEPLRGYTMVGLRGSFDPAAGTLTGKITGSTGCDDFALTSVTAK